MRKLLARKKQETKEEYQITERFETPDRNLPDLRNVSFVHVLTFEIMI